MTDRLGRRKANARIVISVGHGKARASNVRDLVFARVGSLRHDREHAPLNVTPRLGVPLLHVTGGDGAHRFPEAPPDAHAKTLAR